MGSGVRGREVEGDCEGRVIAVAVGFLIRFMGIEGYIKACEEFAPIMNIITNTILVVHIILYITKVV